MHFTKLIKSLQTSFIELNSIKNSSFGIINSIIINNLNKLSIPNSFYKFWNYEDCYFHKYTYIYSII
jgi:hypothetical protein